MRANEPLHMRLRRFVSTVTFIDQEQTNIIISANQICPFAFAFVLALSLIILTIVRA